MLIEEFIFPTIGKFENKYYRKITIQQILDIQNNKE